MMELKNVFLTLNQNSRPLVKNLSFTLNEGDKAAIIGEEGNGKSTLLKYIYDSSLIKNYCQFSGDIKVKGKIGYLSQFLDSEWNDEPVINYFLKENAKCEIDFEKYNQIGDVYRIINNLGLDEKILDDNYLISFLSGGEKVKLQLSKILLNDCDILLLDEPTNDLDIDTLKWLESFINNTNKPIMYVSHDETLLENTANTIIHLEQLKKKSDAKHNIEKMSYSEYVEKRIKGIETQNRLASNDSRNYRNEMQILKEIKSKVQKANPGRTNRMNSLLAQEKRLSEEERIHKADVEEAINIRFNDIDLPNGKEILDLNIPCLKVDNYILSENISLFVQGPEHVVIVGQNGVGKSTLIKHIYDILREKENIKLGYMPQNYNDILDNNRVSVDYLKESNYDESVVRSLMGNMKFTRDEMISLIGDLSGGQKAKLLLIKLILEECNVLLLDEPTRNLSPLSNPVIRNILRNYNGAIISVSHDRKYIDEVCSKAYTLKKDGLYQSNIDEIVGSNYIKKR